MADSDAPPPGAPSMRGSRWWAFAIIAVILVFLVWFAVENWGTREPGPGTTVPVQQPSGDR